MRVLVVGLRGLPNVEGGVEVHVEELYRRLTELGVTVEVAVRKQYHSENAKNKCWQGIRYRVFWAPAASGLEAFFHTFLVVCWAAFSRPDVLHLHAIGPGLFAPLARLFGLRVVFTHHGPDYDREKWGSVAKCALRLGEALGCKSSHRCIAISRSIKRSVLDRYGVECELIPNGVPRAIIEPAGALLQSLELVPGKYILQVSRLVPEKRQLDLLTAFEQSNLADWRLVFVGGLDPKAAYVEELLVKTQPLSSVVLTGFRTGSELRELFSNAGLFVLPSMHEGLPIALLEAMSYGLTVVASDIAANLEIGLPANQYYRMGDVGELSQRLKRFAASPTSDVAKEDIKEWVGQNYSWEDIAARTLTVLESACAEGRCMNSGSAT